MSTPKTKFTFLAKQLANPDHDEAEPTAVEAPAPVAQVEVEEPLPSPALPLTDLTDSVTRPRSRTRVQAPEPPRRVGRPTGKRSDGEHVQVTAYIRQATHIEVKATLLRDRKGRDFSELVEELLSKWLKSNT